VIRLRDQRDDLRLEIKALVTDAAARTSLEAKLSPIEQEIQTIEAGLQRHETAAAELRTAVERHTVAKQAWEKLFEQVEQMQSTFNAMTDYIAIQERATPASETVEDWKMPIAIGALGGGFIGGIIGFLLSFFILRSPALPPLPSAG